MSPSDSVHNMKFALHHLPEPIRWFIPQALICHGFGSGLIRPASGTWGSFLAFLLLIVVFEPLTLALRIMSAFILYWVGYASIKYITQKAKEPIGDASWIVIDEWAGLMIASLLCNSVSGFFVAFLLFRLFDIWKPWPISWIDKTVHGPHGVMLDDVVAGIIALAIFGLLSYVRILPI